jgi:hypothetical protein
MNESPAFDALIEWESTKPGEAQVLAGRYARNGLISECFLRGGRASLAARGSGFGLTVEHSVLVNMESAFRIDAEGKGPSANSTIDVRNSTLSSVEQCVDVRFGSVVTDDAAIVAVFADESYFAPPASKPRSGATAIVTAPRAARDRGKIVWCGTGNGYAPEVNAYFRIPGRPPADEDRNFEAAWMKGWGAGHELRPLFQGDDVALHSPVPEPGKIQPLAFQFAETAKAATWTIDGYAIGAELSWFEMPTPSSAPKPKPGEKPKPEEKAKSAEKRSPIEPADQKANASNKGKTSDSPKTRSRRLRDRHDKYN